LLGDIFLLFTRVALFSKDGGLIHNWDKALITVAAFGLLTSTEVNPVWLAIAGAILGYPLYR